MDLFKGMAAGIEQYLNDTARALSSFVYDYVTEQYTNECSKTWPLKDEENNEILDPVTNTKFDKEEEPERFTSLVKESTEKASHDGMTYPAKITVWVDATGLPNEEKLLRAGRMMELYGCKPWTNVKAMLRGREKFSSIVKDANT